MKQFGKSALLFVAIGLLLYAGVFFATERLLMRNGHSNPFFKIATAEVHDYDWVILGASHAMPFDFADFNALMQRETGLRIINLAAQGTGPLYNRFVFEHFLRAHRTRNLLYVVDSFALTSRAWNEDRFSRCETHSRNAVCAGARAAPGGLCAPRRRRSARAARLSQRLFQDQQPRPLPARCLGRRSAVRSGLSLVGNGGRPAHRIPLSGRHDAGRPRALSQAVCRPDRDRPRTRHPRDRRQAAGAGAVP